MKRFWLRHKYAARSEGLCTIISLTLASLAAWGLVIVCRFGALADDAGDAIGLLFICTCVLAVSAYWIAASIDAYRRLVVESDDDLIAAVTRASARGWDIQYDEMLRTCFAGRDLGRIRFAIWRSHTSDVWKLSIGVRGISSIVVHSGTNLSDMFAFHDKLVKELKDKL